MLSTPSKPPPPPTELIEESFWDYFNISTVNVTSPGHGDVTRSDQGFIVGIYSVLLVFGAVGNSAVFASLVRSRRRKSRVNLLMTHLAVADLVVVLFVIPLEVRDN